MKKVMKVAVIGRFSLETLSALKADHRLSVIHISGTENFDSLSEIEALLIRSTTPVDESLLSKAPMLKYVITSTVGYDHMNLKLMHARGVRAFFCPSASTQSAAELTFTLLLTLAKKIPLAQQNIKSGKWRQDNNRGIELNGKTLGIVGFGRVGKRVSKIAQAFGMKVYAHDPYLENEVFTENGVERLGLDELLKVVDVISLHVPATPETQNMLHRIYLDNTSEDTILINTSRGQVLKLQELKWALDHKRLGFIGLDVFENEPVRPDDWYLHDPRVVCTPHIGATTAEALLHSSQEAYRKLIELYEGQNPQDELPEKTLWGAGLFLSAKGGSEG